MKKNIFEPCYESMLSILFLICSVDKYVVGILEEVHRRRLHFHWSMTCDQRFKRDIQSISHESVKNIKQRYKLIYEWDEEGNELSLASNLGLGNLFRGFTPGLFRGQ